METELKILRKIWENNGEVSIRLLSRQTGLGIDYTRYICTQLVTKEEIEPVKGKRDWYWLLPKGESKLRLAGIMEPKDSKKMGWGESPKGRFEPDEKKLSLGRSLERAISRLIWQKK